MDIENLKILQELKEIHTPYYIKMRVSGVKNWSDIYQTYEDDYVELPNCNSMEAASDLAKRIIDYYLETVADAGNEITAYMVAKK